MKYLENANLDRICSVLSNNATDCHLDMRLEAYSCKMVTSEKKQWKKSRMTHGQGPQPLSAPDQPPWPMSLSVSPLKAGASRFRHLSEPSCSGSDNDTDEAGCVYLHAVTTRTLFDLVGVLNTSFPDYDFSHIKSESFSLIPNLSSLIGLVDLKLSATVSNYNEIKEALWREIDEVIKVNDCKIYSYQTEYSGDPFSEDGVMWSFSYFFSNKSLKRILFMSCRALRSDPSLNLSAEELWGFEA
uniref:Repressor of RNA polymerase III transcription MAF1 n=1 Tax=Ascaris lumbricoides TaxID=6252 RepID=A0A0M3HW72_ASCLU